MALDLNKDTFDTEVLKAEGTVLIDFWASWCGPCRMLSPVIDQIAQAHPSVKVCKVNVDDNQELAAQYSVASIPTVIVFKNGKLTGRSVGLVPKQKIEELL